MLFLANTRLVKWNIRLLWVLFFGQIIVMIPFLMLLIIVLTTSESKDARAFAAIFNTDTINFSFTLIYNVFYLAWNIVFFVWLGRIVINSNRLTSLPKRSVVWSITFWFIPVIQLVFPYRLMRKLFNCLNSELDNEDHNLSVRSKTLVNQWWLACFLSWTLEGLIIIGSKTLSHRYYLWLAIAFLFQLCINMLFVLTKVRMIKHYNHLELKVIARYNQVMLVENNELLDR